MKLDTACNTAAGLLTLLAFRGVGRHTAQRLAEHFERLGDILEATPERLASIVSRPFVESLSDRPSWESASAQARRIIEEADEHSIRVLAVGEEGYPDLLRLIPDRPAVVYVKGALPDHHRNVACVGTREPSWEGEIVAGYIAGMLGKNGWNVVSGLASGVETEVHEAALGFGGHTVAVLPNGLDSVYPKKSAALAERILDSGGALLSEHAVGAAASGRAMAAADRLKSGVSSGTVLVESDYGGRALHTVRYSLLQGRPLFVPVYVKQYTKNPQSRAVYALGHYDGPKLCSGRYLKPDSNYQDVLCERFRNRPPGIRLEGRNNYRTLLAHLEGRVPPRESEPNDEPDSQLALF